MKKLVSIAFLVFLVSGLAAQTTFQATLKRGAAGDAATSEVELYLKPSGAVTTAIIDFVFTIQIPTSVGPKPTVAVSGVGPAFVSSFAGGWTPIVEATADGYYHYRFALLNPAVTENIVFESATEKLAVKLKVSGGVGAGDVRLAHLANGGGDVDPYFQQFQFVIQTTGNLENPDATNYLKMFYGDGSVPVNPVANIEAGYATYQYVQVGNITLPVKFLSFYAVKGNNGANLTWTVENDAQNKEFVVERSFNGREFEAIATVPAKANGRQMNNYDLVDNKLNVNAGKVWYYRIIQYDQDGQMTYSQVRNINLEMRGAAQLYPNPAKATTKFVFASQVAEKATLLVQDMGGRLMMQFDVRLNEGVNQQDLNVSRLAAGEYNVVLITESQQRHLMKLTKIN